MRGETHHTSALLRLIGSKGRLAGRLVDVCSEVAGNRDVLVDVFGGSAAVTLAASTRFPKRVYNDLDGDLVGFFRVLAEPGQRLALHDRLRHLPASREIFDHYRSLYVRGANSFALIRDPVERAVATFYRNAYCYGGKMRCGGFSVSLTDRGYMKERRRYRSVVAALGSFAAAMQEVVIEHLHYQDLVSLYGNRANTVLFVDPPYMDTEHYYSVGYDQIDQVFLALQLAELPAPVVVTLYPHPRVDELYPANVWERREFVQTKNSMGNGRKEQRTELCLIKRAKGHGR